MSHLEPHLPGTSSRRSILQRGLLALAGALGMGAAANMAGAAKPAAAASVPAAHLPTRLQFHGRHWHQYSPERSAGTLPVKGERLSMYGELLDAPAGARVGEFYAACFCLRSPFGPGAQAAETMEMHTFNLAEGTIIGMGTMTPSPHGLSVFAILGGTGRYLGARGSYTCLAHPLELGGDGTATFEMAMTTG